MHFCFFYCCQSKITNKSQKNQNLLITVSSAHKHDILNVLKWASASWNDSNYRLTHSASELSGFTCTSSLTMNEKIQYRTRPPSAVSWNFKFIVSELVQVNPDNSRAMSALTFLLFKLNTLQTKIVKLWVSRSHGVMTVVFWFLHHGYYTTIMTSRRLFRHNPVSRGTNQPIRKSEFVQCMKFE